jgi:hypothetical protein
MKKILLTSLLIGCFSGAQAQDQVSNGGFNIWETIDYGSDPTEWFSAFDAFGGASNPLIEKSTDATDGSYSCKLSTQEYDGDLAFGFVLHGNIGSSGPEGGVPFTLNADSIVFDAKHDIMAGDSSNVYVILKNGGFPIDMQVLRIGGTQNDWTRYSFPVNPWSLVPDSLVLGFTSSETENAGAALGTWIMIDNIRFIEGSASSSPIPDYSFETWEDISVQEPENWYSYNYYTVAAGVTSVNQTSVSSEGAFALELQGDSVELGGGMEFIPGFLTNGTPNSTGGYSGTPFVATPASLDGVYKWSPVNSDEASVQVMFMAGGTEIFAGATQMSTAQSNYTNFSIPITLASAPDTMLIMIYAGDEAGSVLTIDNLRFVGGDVNVKTIYVTDPTLSIYPNPIVNHEASLKLGLPKSAAVNYNIVNTLGQVVASQNLGTMKEGAHTISLKTENLNTGVYFVKVKVGSETMTQRVVVK